ncbi:hypothetical protein ABIF27_005381 [Bradyrhizobium elkanii]
MLASDPASMVNQKYTDLGIPNRFNLTPSRFSKQGLPCQAGPVAIGGPLACAHSDHEPS